MPGDVVRNKVESEHWHTINQPGMYKTIRDYFLKVMFLRSCVVNYLPESALLM